MYYTKLVFFFAVPALLLVSISLLGIVGVYAGKVVCFVSEWVVLKGLNHWGKSSVTKDSTCCV